MEKLNEKLVFDDTQSLSLQEQQEMLRKRLYDMHTEKVSEQERKALLLFWAKKMRETLESLTHLIKARFAQSFNHFQN